MSSKQRWAALALASASMFTAMGALAQSNAPLAEERVRKSGDVLIAGTEWPDSPTEVGFKSLTIGAPFDMDQPLVATFSEKRWIRPHWEKLIFCHLHEVAPIMVCEIRYWNDTDYGPELNALKTAFGDRVRVSFWVQLDSVPTDRQIAAYQFGKGRISLITITNTAPSQDFLERAVAHFTSVAGTGPITRRTFKDPSSTYSEDCMETIARVKNKPIGELSQADIAAESLCDKQALLRVMSGSTRTGWVSAYSWDRFKGRYRAAIGAEEMSNSISGVNGAVSKTVVISLAIEQENAKAAFREAQARVRQEIEAAKLNDDLEDF